LATNAAGTLGVLRERGLLLLSKLSLFLLLRRS
jgi:hypothetical protein